MISNSAAVCSISLKFGTEFEHIKSHLTTNIKSQWVKCQGHSVT